MRLNQFENVARQKPFASTKLGVARAKCLFAHEDVNIRKPFLKWAGAKTKISRLLRSFMPAGDYRFVEPFVGSGAVFVNTTYRRGLLADANEDVINLYKLLKEHKEEFVESCRGLFEGQNNEESKFYELRTEFNRSTDRARRANLFVYLNRHCFNGLCRFNQKGEFNTPFGRYERPYFPAEEMIRFAEKLQTTQLRVADFRQTFDCVGPNDVVYCDPPYLPIGNTGFTEYSGGGFSLEDHEDLALLAESAAERGATVIMSNHDTKVSRELYRNAVSITPVLVARTISCDGENRNKARELIAIFNQVNEHARRTR
jgi:DNA adenine methylase